VGEEITGNRIPLLRSLKIKRVKHMIHYVYKLIRNEFNCFQLLGSICNTNMKQLSVCVILLSWAYCMKYYSINWVNNLICKSMDIRLYYRLVVPLMKLLVESQVVNQVLSVTPVTCLTAIRWKKIKIFLKCLMTRGENNPKELPWIFHCMTYL